MMQLLSAHIGSEMTTMIIGCMSVKGNLETFYINAQILSNEAHGFYMTYF